MITPFEFWNDLQDWKTSLAGVKDIQFIGKEIIFPGKIRTYIEDGMLSVVKSVAGLHEDTPYSPFQLLTMTTHGGNYRSALNYIEYFHMNKEIPYIRVGTDYYKKVNKPDRYGVNRIILKPWRKDEIKFDHKGVDILSLVHQYDDFTIAPNNIDYSPIHDNCYNLYSPFVHTPHPKPCNEKHIPATYSLIQHVFGTGEHLQVGIKYLQCLYQMPQQLLPILTLVSRERHTGKTTVLNWLEMIFGDNYVQINPESLSSSFNSSYATKNIIALDETILDRIHVNEKLKSLATAKTVSVNQKFVTPYSVPFFGKIVLCTNKEISFAKIDQEEIRFFVRKLRPIKNLNTNIESELKKEIPYFLSWLNTLPPIDTSKSRMIFTPEELRNESLDAVKASSWSTLHKELVAYITNHFESYPRMDHFFARAIDIKERWFFRDSKRDIEYINLVIREEMKYPDPPITEENRFGDFENKAHGRFFRFERTDFTVSSSVAAAQTGSHNRERPSSDGKPSIYQKRYTNLLDQIAKANQEVNQE